MGSVRPALSLLAGIACAPALHAAQDCAFPDQGNAPLRRAVARVKYLPETQAWAEAQARSGAVVQYVLSLDEPKRIGVRCYWALDVRADGRLWRRYLVSPDAKRLIADPPP